MKSWRVWGIVPISHCLRRTGRKPLRGGWVDVNKGDSASPEVRCRYVANEVAYAKNALFHSSTPPLEVLRLLISHVASGRSDGRGGRKIMVLDARKAHLHAAAERERYLCSRAQHAGLLRAASPMLVWHPRCQNQVGRICGRNSLCSASPKVVHALACSAIGLGTCSC